MSKKTKKQKIAADLRRNSFSFSQLPEKVKYNNSLETKASAISLSAENTSLATNATVQKASIYIYPVHLIRKDLTKTLLLSILAISLEVALYFILKIR